jgi:hypothetical protein
MRPTERSGLTAHPDCLSGLTGFPAFRYDLHVSKGPAKPIDVHAPVFAEREVVSGSCPECGDEALARYPVVGEHGWEIVVKCQTCLFSVERKPWRRLGPISLLVDSIG